MPHLRAILNWFNDEENSFVIQFSDDGGPEMSELSMSLGTLTLWDFRAFVRNRKKQYLLHALSTIQDKRTVLDQGARYSQTIWLQ